MLLAERFMKERKKQADKWRKKGEVEKARECQQQAPPSYGAELLEKIAGELEPDVK